jgi:hypothetical protein
MIKHGGQEGRACNTHRNSEEKRPAGKPTYRKEDNREFPQKNGMILNNDDDENNNNNNNNNDVKMV